MQDFSKEKLIFMNINCKKIEGTNCELHISNI